MGEKIKSIIANIKTNWKKYAIMGGVIVGLLLFSYAKGCVDGCQHQKNKESKQEIKK